jgi:hypothetical protein
MTSRTAVVVSTEATLWKAALLRIWTPPSMVARPRTLAQARTLAVKAVAA